MVLIIIMFSWDPRDLRNYGVDISRDVSVSEPWRNDDIEMWRRVKLYWSLA